MLAGTRRVDDGSGKRINLKAIAVHPKYGHVANDKDYDVAVVTLTLDYQHVKLARLPDAAIKPGSAVMVTGWGRTAHDHKAARLQKAKLVTMSNRTCKLVFGEPKITDRMLCARSPNHPAGSCVGNSGVPLSGGQGFQTLYGIVSWGNANCQQHSRYGVYVRVANDEISTFIRDAIAN